MDRDIALNYVRRKKRNKRVSIISGISAIVLTIFIIIAFSLIKVDRFTITTSEEPELTLTLDQKELTTQLIAPPLLRASDTQYTYVIEHLDENVGSQNTDYYFAYSFYLGGKSIETKSINYNLAMSLDKYSNNLEEAIRVMVIRNGNKEIYAKSNQDGSAKPLLAGEKHENSPEIIGTTKPFRLNKNIIVESYEIKPGDFDKYTIVMWIDGWESVNEMKGGVFSANIKFSTHSIN